MYQYNFFQNPTIKNDKENQTKCFAITKNIDFMLTDWVNFLALELHVEEHNYYCP